MSTASLVLAVFLLLITPGPTNTLLAVAGASGGFRRSLPLILAENVGYLVTIVPLVTFAGPFLASQPLAAGILKLCSAAWVALLALKLWTAPPARGGGASFVTFRRVLVTTMLNPKALIFGLALLPLPAGETGAMLPRLVLFSGLVGLVACLWLTAGAAIMRGADSRFPRLVSRVAAGFLLFFSASLAGSSLGWI